MLLADRYQLEELLGQGGMGEVWSARDDVLDRPVAVKVLLSHRADETAVERFRREAHAAGLLSHPNVVAVYDFGTHEDSLFLVMELVDGHTLTEELATHGTLSAEQAAGIAAQAAAGLAAAHNQDLVHRDIKPGNLLLTDDGTVKIADFGIARFISDATNDLTSTGQIVGTPYYLAPERATGAPAGPESDVYSLGCVLYQLVTGHPPFEGDTQAAVLYQHVDLPPVPPAELRPELAGPFQDGLLQMLAKDPADRPTAAQLAKWSLDTPPSWSSPAAKVLPTPPAAVAVSSQAVQKSRNRMIQTAVLAAGSTAVSAAIVIGLALDSGPSSNSPTTEPSVGESPSVARSGGPARNATAAPSGGPDSGPTSAGQTRVVMATELLVRTTTTGPGGLNSLGPTPPGSVGPNPSGGPTTGGPVPRGPVTGVPSVPVPSGSVPTTPGEPPPTPAPSQPPTSQPPPTTAPTTIEPPPPTGQTPGRPTRTRKPKP